VGQALADVATIGILSERAIRLSETLTGQLRAALNSRVIIEQAKGVLAQRGNLSMSAAFDRLRRYARTHQARLSEVAREVVETDLAAADVLGAPRRGEPNARPAVTRLLSPGPSSAVHVTNLHVGGVALGPATQEGDGTAGRCRAREARQDHRGGG
jgi:hypothetical protein